MRQVWCESCFQLCSNMCLHAVHGAHEDQRNSEKETAENK